MKKLLLILSVAAISALATSCGDCPKNDPAGDKNAKTKATIDKLYEAFATGNLALLDSTIAPDAVEHTPDPTMPPTKATKGPEMVKEVVQMVRGAFPDMKMKVEKTVIEGNMATVFGQMSGTNSGAMGPTMPATGKSININFFDMFEFDDKGMIKGHWGIGDNVAMMMQLGMMPMPGDTTPPPAADAHAGHTH